MTDLLRQTKKRNCQKSKTIRKTRKYTIPIKAYEENMIQKARQPLKQAIMKTDLGKQKTSLRKQNIIDTIRTE